MPKKIYSGKIIGLSVHDVTIQGKQTTREIIDHPGAAAILAVDDNSQIILVKQDRYPHGYTLEVPAGTLEKGEDPKDCAVRELREETGMISKTLEHMFSYYPSIGYNGEIIHCYLAKGLTDTKIQDTDPDEFIDVVKMDYNKVIEEIKNGNIQDSKTICTVSFYNHL